MSFRVVKVSELAGLFTKSEEYQLAVMLEKYPNVWYEFKPKVKSIERARHDMFENAYRRGIKIQTRTRNGAIYVRRIDHDGIDPEMERRLCNIRVAAPPAKNGSGSRKAS